MDSGPRREIAASDGKGMRAVVRDKSTGCAGMLFSSAVQGVFMMAIQQWQGRKVEVKA